MILSVTKNNMWWHKKNPNIVFFFSCDIQEATKYKTQNLSLWMYTLNNYLNIVEKHISKIFNDLKVENYLWKRLGDETVFALCPKNLNDLDKIYYGAYEVFKYFSSPSTIVDFLGKFKLFCVGYHYTDSILILYGSGVRHDMEEFKGLLKCDYSNYRNDKLLISAKPIKKRKSNACILGDFKQYDFIGSDMDIGFRISKYTAYGKFLVSDKVAYIYESLIGKNDLVLKSNEGEVLKGVWRRHKYPKIFMISRDQTSVKSSIKRRMDSMYQQNNRYSIMQNFIKKTKKILSE